MVLRSVYSNSIFFLLFSFAFCKIQAQHGPLFTFIQNPNAEVIDFRIENKDSQFVYLVIVHDNYHSDSAFVLDITPIDSCGLFSFSDGSHLLFWNHFTYSVSKSYQILLKDTDIKCLTVKYYEIPKESWPPKRKRTRKNYRRYLDYIKQVGTWREVSVPIN